MNNIKYFLACNNYNITKELISGTALYYFNLVCYIFIYIYINNINFIIFKINYYFIKYLILHNICMQILKKYIYIYKYLSYILFLFSFILLLLKTCWKHLVHACQLIRFIRRFNYIVD